MARPQEVDWTALRRSDAFQDLAGGRGRFVRTAVIALLGWFAVFLAVVGAAPALAGTVGFLLGLSQFGLAWFLTWRYLRLSNQRFSGLEEQVRAIAAVGSGTDAPEVTR
jgi:uncharacterized membrane protein (DUF485 family)